MEDSDHTNETVVSLQSIASLSKNGIILNRPSSDKNSYSVKSSIATEKISATPTSLENPTTLSSSAPNESRVFSKSHDDFRIEQIENLGVEVTGLKSFIVEQLYATKKSVEDFRPQSFTPNNLEHIETLKGEIRYLRNENTAKINLLKSLTENKATYNNNNNNTKRPSTGHRHPDRSNYEKLAARGNNMEVIHH